MKNIHISFIGGGNMAASLIGGLLADNLQAGQITVTDPNPRSRDYLAENFGVHTTQDNAAAVAEADVVVLAVKPQLLQGVATALAPAVQARQPLVITVAAGIRSVDLNRWLGGEAGRPVAVVRAMPNTPALVQTGAIGLFASAPVSAAQRDLAESILRAAGLTLWVEDEDQMHAVTALSGSGPAYFFRIMEALEAAGAELGLPAETARLLTLQTALGAAKMALESSETVTTLRERVTSPGGTTEQGLRVLAENHIDRLMAQVLQAAADRSRELAALLGDDQAKAEGDA
ncbi:MAG: pyrroline-5-carboxylate reductase [Gammaproteobacteria bacterium]|nr:pyrroline-5-carboxylate reductase [Gammaproteobacteria bacterium]